MSDTIRINALYVTPTPRDRMNADSNLIYWAFQEVESRLRESGAHSGTVYITNILPIHPVRLTTLSRETKEQINIIFTEGTSENPAFFKSVVTDARQKFPAAPIMAFHFSDPQQGADPEHFTDIQKELTDAGASDVVDPAFDKDYIARMIIMMDSVIVVTPKPLEHVYFRSGKLHVSTREDGALSLSIHGQAEKHVLPSEASTVLFQESLTPEEAKLLEIMRGVDQHLTGRDDILEALYEWPGTVMMDDTHIDHLVAGVRAKIQNLLDRDEARRIESDDFSDEDAPQYRAEHYLVGDTHIGYFLASAPVSEDERNALVSAATNTERFTGRRGAAILEEEAILGMHYHVLRASEAGYTNYEPDGPGGGPAGMD